MKAKKSIPVRSIHQDYKRRLFLLPHHI